jgi:saccharopine dehydrogenase (NAD+, L-lysine-forming)
MDSMKILILGGFGMSGATVAGDLVSKPEVSQVILADKIIDLNKIDAALRTSPKVTSQQFDITDYPSVLELMKGKDVVVNCVGPFYEYGIAPMKAAIEASTNYVDICDDADVIQEAFTLDEAARKAGVSVCIGCGNSPGFSNAVIKYTADKLDEVDEIRILVGIGLGGGFGPSVLYHIFHCLMDSNLQFMDGKLQTPSDWGREVVDFAEPIGKREVFYFGHPEPVTLPRYIKGVKTVVFKLGNLPPWINDWFIKCIELGFAGLKPVKSRDTSVIPRELIVSVLSESAFLEKEKKAYNTANRYFIVKGREGGREVTYTHHIIGLPRGMTGINCSFATQMLYRGEVKEKGILSPEAFIKAEPLLAFWKERGLNLRVTKTITHERPVQF